jgi:GTPase Era involved in 16S rRNA processing
VSKLLKDVHDPVVLVLNKIDLVAKTRLLPVIEQLRQWREFTDIVPSRRDRRRRRGARAPAAREMPEGRRSIRTTT